MTSLSTKFSKKTEKYSTDIAKIFGAGLDAALSPTNTYLGPGGLMAKVYAIQKEASVNGVPLSPNPHFVENGHAEIARSKLSQYYLFQRSQLTTKYFNHRKNKKIGIEALEIVGTAGAVAGKITTGGAFGTNVVSVTKHAGASTSTVIHYLRFKSMAKGVQGSAYLVGLLETLIFMKKMKTGIRGANLTASALGGLPGHLISIVARSGKIGLKDCMGEVIVYTAQELHWRAFVEMRLGSQGGPACAMVKELLTRRTHRFLGGQYNWREIINEPCGWLVIKDKIAMV